MAKEGNKVFYRITNKDIYDKLTSIDDKLNRHRGILKWHSWAIGIMLAIIIAVISKVL